MLLRIPDPLAWLTAALARWTERGLLRRRVTRDGAQGTTITLGGRKLINWGANDYLGLADDPRLKAAAIAAIEQEGFGAGASPLITGHSAAHRQLEADLAAWLETEAALVFPSGFAANAGTIPALVEEGDAIYSDAKNHASLIDGCRMSRANVYIYPHGDMPSLAELLRVTAGKARRRLIATDTVFSMDGDLAPLDEICDLAERFEAMLLVDEAHATGIYGAHGTGRVEQRGLAGRVAVRVGTLSKALGSAGGFVAGSAELIEWLVNRSRPYIFSTAHPAAAAAAASAAIKIVQNEPERRTRLLANASSLREQLAAFGWPLGNAATQIVALPIGDDHRVMELPAALHERGHFIPGIRPPSVPPGEALLRISLSSAHTQGEIKSLAEALGKPI